MSGAGFDTQRLAEIERWLEKTPLPEGRRRRFDFLVAALRSETEARQEAERRLHEDVAELDGRLSTAYQERNAAEAERVVLAGRVEQLEEALHAAHHLLLRLSEWDMLYVPKDGRPPSTAAAPYWQAEIAKVLETKGGAVSG